MDVILVGTGLLAATLVVHYMYRIATLVGKVATPHIP